MINGENLVFARREKWQLKKAPGIGWLDDWRRGRMLGKGKNSGAEWTIVERNISVEGSSIIAEDDFDRLGRAAWRDRQIGFDKIGGAGGGGLHVEHAVRINFNAIWAGRDTLKFERGRSALAGLVGSVAGLKHSGGVAEQADR